MLADIATTPRTWGDMWLVVVFSIFMIVFGVVREILSEWRARRLARKVTDSAVTAASTAAVATATAATTAAEAAVVAKEGIDGAVKKVAEAVEVLNGHGILGAMKAIALQMKRQDSMSNERWTGHSVLIKKIIRRIEKLEKIVTGGETKKDDGALSGEIQTGPQPQ